jgi:hypothetical protein
MNRMNDGGRLQIIGASSNRLLTAAKKGRLRAKIGPDFRFL